VLGLWAAWWRGMEREEDDGGKEMRWRWGMDMHGSR